MKKVFFYLLIILFLFIFNYKVQAQVPTLIPPIPVINCGNAESSEARQCCKPIVDLPELSIPDPLRFVPIVGQILGTVGDLLLLLKRTQNIPSCLIGYPSSSVDDPNCYCSKGSEIPPAPIEAVSELCEKYINSSEREACIACAENGGVWTSLTCVYGDVSRFIREILLGWAIGLAGVIALFCIIYAAFQIQTSQGSPEKIKKAQELLTSCIMGLMLIIFSVFILRLIGVDILRIPGFGR